LIDFDNVSPLEKGINTLQSRYKMSFQPDYVPTLCGKTKKHENSRQLTAVRSVEQIVTNFRRKSFNVPLFPCLLENSYSSVLKKFFILMVFLSTIYLQTQYGKF